MHVFEAERGDDMYTSGASDGASELSRPVSENDSDSEEEYSHSSSSEQEEEPISCTLNMESIPELSFEPLYNGSTVTVSGAYFCIMKYAKVRKAFEYLLKNPTTIQVIGLNWRHTNLTLNMTQLMIFGVGILSAKMLIFRQTAF